MTPLSLESAPPQLPHRIATQKPLHLVDFFCRAPQAKAVFLAGDFNAWDPRTLPMERRPDGGWILRLALSHGHHQYYFIVDGQPMLDPRSTGTVRNQQNQRVSLVAVS
jgi:1,4-alpha-glucan branching enzyme